MAARRPAALGQPTVVPLNGDLITQKPRCSAAGVGDQRFVRGQFQLEVITQELGQTVLDLLGFGLRPGKPEEVVIEE